VGKERDSHLRISFVARSTCPGPETEFNIAGLPRGENMKGGGESDIVGSLAEQCVDLCDLRGHMTPVIANLDIEDDWFEGYDNSTRASFDLNSVVKMFIYKEALGLSQAELARRLSGIAYVYVRFDFSRPPAQQFISYNWRHRFSAEERAVIKQAAQHISDICDDHDLLGVNGQDTSPALEPEDISGRDLSEEIIMNAVERATALGFDEFTAGRADNAKYALESYFERQGYLNMVKAGTTTPRRRFARLSERDEVPHGSSHNRTMKKIADPSRMTTLDEFGDGDGLMMWERIRDEVLEAFHAGVEKQLDEIAGRDREGLRQPVHAAIDITTWNFWPSPYRSEEDVAWHEKPTEITYGNGSTREVHVKDDYPEMVSGLKASHERGYKFATLTIVAEDSIVILAIEPVRDERAWEKASDDIDVNTRGRGELVDRLLEQAEQHVDIHKVFADREFDTHAVRDVIDRRRIQYLIQKRKQSGADDFIVEASAQDPITNTHIEDAELTVDGRSHDVSVIGMPKDTVDNKQDADEDDYILFTTNAEVSPGRAQALGTQYRKRWEIENQYKMIKNNFLPTCASKDYRVRFLYFVIGVIMHNVWRLTNFILRDEVDVHVGEKPPLRAGEIVELIGFFLFDPGD